MRPTSHDSANYASDMASLTRMLRRVVSDEDLPKAARKGLETHYRGAIRLLCAVATPAKAVVAKKRKKRDDADIASVG